ncbi:hypothetical protein OAG68_02080 [bacterium]|nr:hypothetical protein [bacterium]
MKKGLLIGKEIPVGQRCGMFGLFGLAKVASAFWQDVSQKADAPMEGICVWEMSRANL